jgi:hypothetical protein
MSGSCADVSTTIVAVQLAALQFGGGMVSAMGL